MSEGPKSTIAWDESWNIGIEEIDSDHKKLVLLISVLFEALKTNQPSQYIKEVYVNLVDYTKYHFKREEDWMASHNYPGLEEHKLLHQKLISQVLDISSEVVLNTNTDLLGGDIYEFLKQWLVYHILDEDMKLKKLIQG